MDLKEREGALLVEETRAVKETPAVRPETILVVRMEPLARATGPLQKKCSVQIIVALALPQMAYALDTVRETATGSCTAKEQLLPNSALVPHSALSAYLCQLW